MALSVSDFIWLIMTLSGRELAFFDLTTTPRHTQKRLNPALCHNSHLFHLASTEKQSYSVAILRQSDHYLVTDKSCISADICCCILFSLDNKICRLQHFEWQDESGSDGQTTFLVCGCFFVNSLIFQCKTF